MQLPHAVPIGCIVLVSLVCSCHKAMTAEAIEQSPAAISQKGPLGTATWVVGSDGKVSAALKDPHSKPITGAVTGQVTFAAPKATPTSVPVEYDPKTGVLAATGPKLDADLTPVSYSLTVDGSPWNGAIDVPRGGTEELVTSGKLHAAAPASGHGPHGGVVQIIGPDRLELVANKRTGDVRAYVLDADNKPIDPGHREITIALQGEAPELVVLEPEPHAHFVVGHLRTRIDPEHLTVAVSEGGATHACLVGWSPGTVVVVGAGAPRVHLLAVEEWHGDAVVEGQGVVGIPVVVAGPGRGLARGHERDDDQGEDDDRGGGNGRRRHGGR